MPSYSGADWTSAFRRYCPGSIRLCVECRSVPVDRLCSASLASGANSRTATSEHERVRADAVCTVRSGRHGGLVENYNRRPAVPGGGPSLASTALRWSIAVAALAYIAYFALLVTCDLWGVGPLGFVPGFDSEAVTISDVQPGSIGARAGLQPGDRIKRVNTQILQGAADWQRVRVYLDPWKPPKRG